MVLASVAFVFEWIWLAVFSVLLMGIQSCMYSPSKYGLIRDIGGSEGVSFGSGVFETMSFLGILIGSVAAPYLSDHYNVWVVVAIFMGIAVLGYYTCTRLNVKELPVDANELATTNPIRFVLNSYRFAKGHKYVNSAVLGSSVFWLIGGMLQMNVVIHCTKMLGTSNSVSGAILSCAAIGIAAGCSIAGLLSRGTVRPALIPIGLGGMIVCLLALVFFNPPVVMTGVLIFGLAFLGGFFEVPCMALIQHANLGRRLGDMIAYLNLINFVFVLLGTALFSITTLLTSDNSLAVFCVILGACVLMLLYYLYRHPEFLSQKARIE